jgi:predicted acylesterase/phospholipase RssA
VLVLGELLWAVGAIALAIGVHLWAYGVDGGRLLTLGSLAAVATSGIVRATASRNPAPAPPPADAAQPAPDAKPTKPHEDDETEEVRVALALNGGVSLAVWMGGCAVELDAARRAGSGVESLAVDAPSLLPTGRLARLKQFVTGDPPRPAPPSAKLPQRTVYHGICTAFRRRLVLDVFSGASAGGINGALLAGAISEQRRLHPDFIREKWLGLGDFARLLQKTSMAHPHSLMQGRLFHEDLAQAFDELLGPANSADPRALLPADQLKAVAAQGTGPGLKLEVTTTDVVGVPTCFLDVWKRPLSARDYRARFRFESPGDFRPDDLAQAARSSASFPGAFEPWHVADDAAGLARLGTNRWVVDGGLLDNAPIRVALNLIPAQPAAGQVRRFACYVNPAPDERAAKAIPSEGPGLTSVLGYANNLPRKAPFIDELRAVEAAARQAALAGKLELELLELPWATLQATAESLLAGYARRRLLVSLEDIFGEPAVALRAFTRLEEGPALPWIPSAFPPAAGQWGWGIRAGQRALHLLIDLLRIAINRSPFDERKALFDARAALDTQLDVLETAHSEFVHDENVRATLEELVEAQSKSASDTAAGALRTLVDGYDARVLEAVVAGADAVAVVAAQLEETIGAQITKALFGPRSKAPTPLTPFGQRRLIRRVLAVEVVRRATWADEDIESAQRVRFVQLTPYAPGLIFAANPLKEDGWATPDDKLTGIELGHFAAFYRGSWRANDYMWGRLDAAARVVDMLVDDVRAIELGLHGATVKPWVEIAAAVLPGDATMDQRWLVHEVLTAESKAQQAPLPSADDLRTTLEEKLRTDLVGGGNGQLTRAVCTRAAQYEVLRQELPWLEREAKLDTKLGAGTAPLGIDTDGDLRPAIEALRPPGSASLPVRLGRSRAELSSSLALRTMAHTGLVALGIARTANSVLGSVVFPLRSALLPVAGLVSRVPAYRLLAVLGFWAASLYVTERMLTLDPKAAAELGTLSAKATLVELLAIFVVIGVAAVPVVRVALGSRLAARVAQAVCALALLAAGGALAVAVAVQAGADWAHVVVAPGAKALPEWVLGLALVLLAGRIVRQLRPVRFLLRPLGEQPWPGWPAAVAIVVLAGAVVHFALGPVWAFHDDGGLSGLAAQAAVLAAPVFACLYAFVRNPVKRIVRKT